MKTHVLLAAAVACLFCGGALASDFQLPAPDLTRAEPKPSWVTKYEVIEAKTMDVGVPLLDVHDQSLTKPIAPLDWCKGVIEGTFKIDQDGSSKVFNFVQNQGAPQVDCLALFDANKIKISDKGRIKMPAMERSRFAPAKGPYGDGVKGYVLVPYRTIAVDRKFIDYGSVVFIKEARGCTLRLPNGSYAYHDGFFLAADRGGGVSGNHIDLFCGLRNDNCMPSVIQSNKHITVHAYKVTDVQAKNFLEALHRPQSKYPKEDNQSPSCTAAS